MQDVGERIWPGLASTPMPVLLVTESAEFLVRPGEGDALQVSSRPRRFAATLLATFPIDGVPTIVTGTAERTGKSSIDWVLTLVHEHFHQWQYTRRDYYAGVARLNLSGGDTTGMWMLNYPFPYDSAPVARALRRLASTLQNALADSALHPQKIQQVVHARDAVRAQLSDADYRYFEFQLWQEGVARYIEYRAADLAGSQGNQDSQPYRAAAQSARRLLVRELEGMDPMQDRRVSFYPIGAAIALLLDRVEPGWKRRYAERPFDLSTLLAGGKIVK